MKLNLLALFLGLGLSLSAQTLNTPGTFTTYPIPVEDQAKVKMLNEYIHKDYKEISDFRGRIEKNYLQETKTETYGKTITITLGYKSGWNGTWYFSEDYRSVYTSHDNSFPSYNVLTTYYPAQYPANKTPSVSVIVLSDADVNEAKKLYQDFYKDENEYNSLLSKIYDAGWDKEHPTSIGIAYVPIANMGSVTGKSYSSNIVVNRDFTSVFKTFEETCSLPNISPLYVTTPAIKSYGY